MMLILFDQEHPYRHQTKTLLPFSFREPSKGVSDVHSTIDIIQSLKLLFKSKLDNQVAQEERVGIENKKALEANKANLERR